jgi:hypothetical protein
MKKKVGGKMDWILVKDKTPIEGQAVIYFFEYVGVYRGHYTEIEYCEEMGLDENGQRYKGDQFYCDGGFLTDDVTHWQPDEGQDLPERPVLDIAK